MPYENTEQLPDSVKQLSEEKQNAWMQAFNSAYQQYDGDETKSAAVAWAVVNKTSVSKVNDEQQLVFGWANISTIDNKPVVDHHDDKISINELEKATYNYVMKSRTGKAMHSGEKIADLVECMVFTKQKQEMLGIDLGKEGVWVGFKIHDKDIFDKVKNGEYSMFSIGGKAKRIKGE